VPSHPPENPLRQIRRKVIRQQPSRPSDHARRGLDDFLYRLLRRAGTQADLLRLGGPVTSLDFLDQVVIAAAAHRHGEPGLARRNLILPRADDRMGGQHVVDRRGTVTTTGQMGDAEVLGGYRGQSDLTL